VSTVGMPQTTVGYVIDQAQSTFTARAFATGILSSFGHNPTISIPDFTGEIHLSPDAIEQSSMRLVIRSASLNVADDIREKDRAEINRGMQQEVLESETYPEIVYKCSGFSGSKIGEGQYWGSLKGELSLHGVTRSQPVAIRISVNGDALKATGDFTVRQSDYEIRPVSAVGGTIKLKDELKFSFDISAHKQE
jgi:polyisoprenoid-binding protein YceI